MDLDNFIYDIWEKELVILIESYFKVMKKQVICFFVLRVLKIY